VVSYRELLDNKANILLKRSKGLRAFLLNYVSGAQIKPMVNLSKSQYYLFKMLQRIFPNRDMRLNYKHPELYYNNTNIPMELDIYIFDLSLGFEYQVCKMDILEGLITFKGTSTLFTALQIRSPSS
jgi:hypothetical protein